MEWVCRQVLLYDLEADPNEEHNRAEDHPQVVAQLQQDIQEAVLRRPAQQVCVATRKQTKDSAGPRRSRGAGLLSHSTRVLTTGTG